MPVILRDVTSDALSLSIEQNNIDLFYAAARAGAKTILQEPEISKNRKSAGWFRSPGGQASCSIRASIKTLRSD